MKPLLTFLMGYIMGKSSCRVEFTINRQIKMNESKQENEGVTKLITTDKDKGDGC